MAGDGDFDELLNYIRTSRGFDFTGYKRASLTRRIAKRMLAVGCDDYRSYQSLLEAQPDEFHELFNTILINVTSFFRDADAWRYIADAVVPAMLETKNDADPIRVWSAGCATGEEAYSLAMLLCDAVGEERYRQTVKIYGTDADDDALLIACQARYPTRTLTTAFDDDQRARFFEGENGTSVFRSDLRRSVIFGRHDLVQDPPISRVDLLVCRNTLMYFNVEIQRHILSSFHFALNPGGFLFLGKSEALATRTNLFVPNDVKHHIFVKQGGPRQHHRYASPPPVPIAGRSGAPGLIDAAFEAGSVAQIVVDRDGNLSLANRRARMLFGIGLGQVGAALKDLELSYRPLELRSRIEEVLTGHRPITINDVELELTSGTTEYLDVHLMPLGSERTISGVSVTFAETGGYKMLRDELGRAQTELAHTYDELQSAIEELETTNEELQSTNEELETTNEELHSANEELETMNEELQSTNEELETINTELRQRSGALDDANAFLYAILSSLGVGVIVLGDKMHVSIWNREAEELWGLRSDEVVGQPFLNLDIGLPVDKLRKPIRTVLNASSENEHVVVSAINRRGRAVSCAINVSPLRGGENEVQGVILVMEVSQEAT